MTILIGYKCALNYWQQAGPEFLCDYKTRRTDTRRAIKALASTEKPSYQQGEWLPYGCTLPLDILVGNKKSRTTSKTLTSHVWTKIPTSAFVAAGGDFLISTPEFCFLQMARSISLIELIRLGFELCGTYSIGTDSQMTSRKRPLTSVSKLRALVDSATQIPGRTQALRALRYIRNNSASPMETKLVMYLCLPYKLGGYGLPWPHLNYRIDITTQNSHLADRSFCVCDLAWPERRLTAEYDSLEYHLDPNRQASDSSRRTTLATLGWTVTTVSANKVRYDNELDLLAHQLGRLFKKQFRYDENTFKWARRSLRMELSRK